MLRIAIADDEEYVLDSIKDRIIETEMDVGIVGFARNGVEAMELLKKKKPDVFFVDINMPMMDGIAFVQKIREQFPEITTKFVIISGYDDFIYLQKAIQLGICDYLRKPIIQEELLQVLNKLMNLFLKEQKQINLLKYSCQFYHQFRENLYDFTSGTLVICHGKQIVNYTERIYFEAKISAETMTKSEEEIAVQMILWPEMENILGIFLENLIFGKNQIREFTERIHITAKYFYSLVHKQDLDDMVQEIEELMNVRFVNPSVRYFECTKQKSIQKLSFKEFELSLFYGNIPETRKAAREMLSYCLENENNIALLAKCYREIHVILMNNLLKHGLAVPDSLPREIQKFALSRFDKTEQITEKTEELISYVIEKVQGQTQKSELVTSVVSYLQEHYAENITLNDLADYFFVTPTYLSKKFKEKCNVNISQYLENIRLEAARHLLRISNVSVSDVAAETGYPDSNYFSRVFKKATGYTPSEYRNLPEEE